MEKIIIEWDRLIISFLGNIEKLEIKDQNGNLINEVGTDGSKQLWVVKKDPKGGFIWFSPEDVKEQLNADEDFYIDFAEGIGVTQISEITAIKTLENPNVKDSSLYRPAGNLINDTYTYVRMGPFKIPNEVGLINDMLIVDDKGNYFSPQSETGGYRQLWVGKRKPNGKYNWYWPGDKTSITNSFRPGDEFYVEWVPTDNENKFISKIVYITEEQINVKVDDCKIDYLEGVVGEYYTRTGPFNLKFSGTIENLEIKDQDGNIIPTTKNGYRQLWFSSKDGTNYNWFTEGQISSNIVSGQDFYIDLAIDSGVTDITGISGKNDFPSVYTAKMWELRNGSTQGLLLVEPGEKEGGVFDFDIPLICRVNTNIALKKINEHTGKPLSGVTFKVKLVEKDKYISNVYSDRTAEYTSSEKDAKIFTTDENGYIHIENVLLGTYEWYEIYNPYYGFQYVEQENINNESIKNAKERQLKKFFVKAEEGKNNYIILTYKNIQRYVKLTGYVWQDIQSEKQSIRNNRWRDDENDNQDIRKGGIKVVLKDSRTGETVKHPETGKEQVTTTSDNGGYIFKELEIDRVEDYYVEFEYDGLVYQSVPYSRENLNIANASKSSEWGNRKLFNDRFVKVDGFDEKTISVNNGRIKLEYELDKENHVAIFDKNTQNTRNYLPIISNTEELGKMVTTDKIKSEYITEIRNVNLGIYERAQADLAIMKDLEQVKVGLKGYDHIYKYATRFENEGTDENGEPIDNGWDLAVKYRDKYQNNVYDVTVYRADYDYENEHDRDSEMKMYLTYRMVLRNESTINSRVNSIIDEYGHNYKVNAVGTGLVEETNEITGLLNFEQLGQGKIKIDTSSIDLNPGKNTTGDIYVQFELSRQDVKDAVDKDIVIENKVEIDSYTSYDENGNLYAAVDIDSVPGNMHSNLEDDNDKAPNVGLKLPIDGNKEIERTVVGKVFEDGHDEKLLKDQNIREGDGIYNDGEATVEGVKVELLEKVGDNNYVVKQKLNEKGDMVNIESITDKDGNYTLLGFEPGEYKVRFTWKDGLQKVKGTSKVKYENVLENYKATVFDKNRYEKENSNTRFYQEGFSEDLTHGIDNWEIRKEIDKQQNSHDGGENNGYNYVTNVNVERMLSDTCLMTFPIEKNDKENNKVITDGTKKEKYEIDKMSFGIIERAKQNIKFDKRVAEVKVKLPDGRLLADVNIGKNGKTSGLTDYVAVQSGKDGFVKIEMDAELMQTSDLEIVYEYTIKNTSEADFYNKVYYDHGNKFISNSDKDNSIVRLTASKIIDYLDSQNIFRVDDDRNIKTGWKSNTFKELENSKIVKSDTFNGIDKKQFNCYYREADFSNMEDEAIAPWYISEEKHEAGEKNFSLATGKTLAIDSNIDFINQAEIVEINKPFGSKIECTPGNYEPNSGSYEIDTAISEKVKVMKSTGGNGNILVIATAIGIGLLSTLGIGLYLIKKKVI